MARGLGRLFGRNAADNLNGPPPFMTPLIDDVVSHGVAPVRRLIFDASLRPEISRARQANRFAERPEFCDQYAR
jgi:hypothetical protein